MFLSNVNSLSQIKSAELIQDEYFTCIQNDANSDYADGHRSYSKYMYADSILTNPQESYSRF